MKLAIGSDLHLEFGPITIKNTQHADVLILAGDICTAKDFKTRDSQNQYSKRYYDFFDQVSSEFKDVIYILGNHEHYGYDINRTIHNIRDRLCGLSNIHVIEKDSTCIDGVTFVGTTLWTNLNYRDPYVMATIPTVMNDFRQIKVDVRTDIIHNDPPRLTPDMWCDEYQRCRKFLDGAVNQDQTVVVTHFTPSYQSCHAKYFGDRVMNAAFHNELFDFVYDNPKIALWIHGHTHDECDYVINQTRIMCNPRGYSGYESRVLTWDLKYVDI